MKLKNFLPKAYELALNMLFSFSLRSSGRKWGGGTGEKSWRRSRAHLSGALNIIGVGGKTPRLGIGRKALEEKA